MEILRGMEVKITGVIHRLIFFLKNKYFFFIYLFIFFFGGGGAYLCKLLGGGAAPVPPIPTALLALAFTKKLALKQNSEDEKCIKVCLEQETHPVRGEATRVRGFGI